MGVRDESRRQVTAAIRAAARRQIAEVGGGALSMRAIAREVGLVSSAVYRYFPTREALLTAMIVESYGNLASALPATEGLAGAEAWRTLGRGLRAWARSVPHEFQLIYGTPIPGYVAPPETVPAAAAVAEPFLRLAPRSAPDAFGDPVLADQFGALGTTFPDADGAGLAAVLAELATLIGFISLELSGHFVGTADPADALYEALLSRQVATLGLA